MRVVEVKTVDERSHQERRITQAKSSWETNDRNLSLALQALNSLKRRLCEVERAGRKADTKGTGRLKAFCKGCLTCWASIVAR